MADSNVTLRAAGLLTQLRTQDLGLPAAGSQRGAPGERQAATLVEAAFLIAAADGQLQLEELGELATLVGGVLGGTVSPGDLATLLESFQDTLEKEGKAARITAIAASATELDEQREILRFASLVALCDNDLAPSELFVLHSLGRAFGMGADEVNGILRPLKDALGQASAEDALGRHRRGAASAIEVPLLTRGLAPTRRLTAAPPFAKVTPMAQSTVATRVRRLLEKKAAAELPSMSKVEMAARARKESTADDFFSCLVEAAFLVSAADGELSAEEESTLGETIGEVTGDVLPPEEFMAMINSFAKALAEDGVEGRARAMAAVLPDEAARKEVLAFAALLALCDHDLHKNEEDVLYLMGKAFSFDEDQVIKVVKGVMTTID